MDFYACEVHGVFKVQIIFAPAGDGGHRVSHRVLPGGEWKLADEELRCPHCGRPLTRYERDYLDRTRPSDIDP